MTSQPIPYSMTDEQRDFLISSGAMTVEQIEKSEKRVFSGKLAELETQTKREAIVDTYSSREVARRLEVDESSSKLHDLYSFTHNHMLCYPTWQFTENMDQPLLPGLDQLVASIPEDMKAASIRGFMTTPQGSLCVGEQAVTPIEWLLQGNNVQDVIDTLNSFLI